MIPYARQDINKEDINAVKKVLKSDWLTQGPMVERFEKAVNNYTNSKYATAVSSATGALHIACLALGVGPGDWVWTSPNTFVSSANCALYCGARVDFVDIDPQTYNLSITKLEAKLKDAKKRNKLPKVIIPVHFGGQPCEMIKIHKLSKRYNFKIIEDASHAIGASYTLLDKNIKKKIKIGSCTHSDITVFSFHPVKIITTGEGGMALTNKLNIYEKLRLLRTHGITRETKLMKKKSDGPWYYQQLDLGFNYRMNDIQAALGYQQIKRIEDFIKRRNIIAKRYNDALKGLPINKQYQQKDTYSAFHLYVITLNKKFNANDHLNFFNKMRKKKIGVNLHYIPVHTQPYYQKIGFKKGDFPEVEDYYNKAISLPMYPSLLPKEQNRVIESLKECL